MSKYIEILDGILRMYQEYWMTHGLAECKVTYEYSRVQLSPDDYYKHTVRIHVKPRTKSVTPFVYEHRGEKKKGKEEIFKSVIEQLAIAGLDNLYRHTVERAREEQSQRNEMVDIFKYPLTPWDKGLK